MAAVPPAGLLPTRWAGRPDADVLHALTRRDEDALRELFRRYAPAVYALASRAQVAHPDQGVQDAFLEMWRRAECQSRSRLDARTWMLIVAYQSFHPG